MSCSSSKEAEKGKAGVLWPILVTLCPCGHRSLKCGGRDLGTPVDPGMGEIELVYFFSSLFNSFLKYLFYETMMKDFL